MPLRRNWMVFGCTVGLLSMLLLVSAASAFASASVRFVHAVPGGAPATLKVSVDGPAQSTAPVSFGTVSAPLEVDPGSATLTAAPAAGAAKPLAEADQKLKDGRSYIVVALAKEGGDGADLQVYPSDEAGKGKAIVRAIHAAPEL